MKFLLKQLSGLPLIPLHKFLTLLPVIIICCPTACTKEDKPDHSNSLKKETSSLPFTSKGRKIADLPSKDHPFSLSADGQQKWFVVVNGQEMPGYSFIVVSPYDMDESLALPEAVFSQNSRRFGYILKDEKGRDCVIVDGKQNTCYVKVKFLTFGKGENLAYVGSNGEGSFLWFNGKIGKNYVNIHKSIFSPDGKHLAYLAEEDGKWFVVLNGKESRKYDKKFPSSFNFSPDAKFIGYNVQKGKEIWWVVKKKIPPKTEEF